MQVKILSEHGYEEALFGLGLSHGVTSGTNFVEDFMYYEPMEVDPVSLGITHEPVTSAEFEHMEYVAQKLAPLDRGHNTFLAMIGVWLDIQAPRYWWQEADRYKVGTVLQSESTMHTIHKKEFTVDDFESDYNDRFVETVKYLNMVRNLYNKAQDQEHKKKFWRQLIQLLPQSFLQRRILYCNYMNLQNIIIQRKGHKLQEWAFFIESIHAQCQHPELLP